MPLHEQAAIRWANRELSNYDYLMLLNNMCGRREEDPQMQPIFPWIINFRQNPDPTDPSCWRDLTKSKYRLTKGKWALLCERIPNG